MHELSLAISIIDIVKQEIANLGANKVTKIELEIGELACVENEALCMALKEAAKDTYMEDAEVIIENNTGIAHCLCCNQIFSLNDIYDPCPNCNYYKSELIQGKEIKIKSLEII